MQKVKGQPDEPVEKDPIDDEDDVVDAIAPNKHYYRPIPGDLDEGDVVPFRKRTPKMRTDPEPELSSSEEKFGAQWEKQQDQRHRYGVGEIPCPYCDDVWCDFDCDESQMEESVTGIGGRDVSGDDPSLGGEYQGHPGLDEEEDDVEEEDLVEFVSDHGIRYAGRVITKNSRYVILEMHDKRRVKTRIGNPSLKKL